MSVSWILVSILTVFTPQTTRVNPSPEAEGTTMEDMAAQSATRKMRYIPLIYCFLRMWGTGHLLFTEYPAVRHMRAFDWLLVIRVGEQPYDNSRTAVLLLG